MTKELLSLTLLALLAVGCEPTCEQTCEDLLACDELETDRVALDDCTAACLVQQQLYDDWDDEDLKQGFADYKRCVSETTCEGIAQGECYDEDIYAW